MYKIKGREVDITVSGYGDETIIESGYYTDTGEELTDDEMDYLMNAYGCDIVQAQADRYADALYDLMNDK